MFIVKQRLDKGVKTFQEHRTAQYLEEMSTVLGGGACAVTLSKVPPRYCAIQLLTLCHIATSVCSAPANTVMLWYEKELEKDLPVGDCRNTRVQAGQTILNPEPETKRCAMAFCQISHKHCTGHSYFHILAETQKFSCYLLYMYGQ